MRTRIRNEILSIAPIDAIEAAHIADALAWVDSGAEVFRIAKPSTPPKHLVAYFALVDDGHILLVVLGRFFQKLASFELPQLAKSQNAPVTGKSGSFATLLKVTEF